MTTLLASPTNAELRLLSAIVVTISALAFHAHAHKANGLVPDTVAGIQNERRTPQSA